jgi:FkbM family methyltransferase
MKELLEKLLGKANYTKLEGFKKRLWPTSYDKQQHLFLKEQVNFYSAFIKPNDLCFDVGGNMGFKTKVFLNLQARVVTLEPQRDCVEILNARYGEKATILQKGAGAANEVKEFYVSDNSALSSFTKDWVDDFKDSRFAGSFVKSVEKIEIVTLDSLIDTYGKPAFIKIDVEGFELEVMKGLSRPFGCLSFEYAVPEKQGNVIAALQDLQTKYPNLLCNHAIGDSSVLALKEWLPVTEMMHYVKSHQFNASFAGDVYVRNDNF